MTYVVGLVVVFGLILGLAFGLRIDRQPRVLAPVGPRVPQRRWLLGAVLLLGTSLLVPFGAHMAVAAGPQLTLTNLDGAPADDWMAFSYLKNRDNANGTQVFHNVGRLRLTNTGDAPLTINGASIDDGYADTQLWAVTSSSALPVTLNAGQSVELAVEFKPQSSTAPYSSSPFRPYNNIYNGTLAINTSIGARTVRLSGFWQFQSESDMEPGLGQIVRVFGYSTTIVGANERLNTEGEVKAVGQEIISPYWRRADAGQPLTVQQLAMFKGCCDRGETLRWFDKGNPGGAKRAIVTASSLAGQSVLPQRADGAEPASGTASPTGAFGFYIDGDSIFSDPALNKPQEAGVCDPATEKCGHFLRFWPAYRGGQLVPNTYIMASDYNSSSTNFDYQDVVYLVSNIRPDDAAAQPATPNGALYRVDAGGRDGFTFVDSNGYTWQSDDGFFAPNAPDEDPDKDRPIAAAADLNLIGGTTDDHIFRTYRGNVGSTPPKKMTYSFPAQGKTRLGVKLYFAERYWGKAGRPGIGQRVFDVAVEGQIKLNDFDIYAAAGSRADQAVTRNLGLVTVNDGNLTIDFTASKDNTSIAAIEIYCDGPCGNENASPTPTPTASPSATPSGSASPSASPLPSGSASPSASPSPSTSPLPRRANLPWITR